MQQKTLLKQEMQYEKPYEKSPPSSSPLTDELSRTFNTAIVATRANTNRDFAGELAQIMESDAFRAILSAVRGHARSQGLSERQAAEEVILTFRRIDQAWSDYVFQEGVDRLRQH